MRPRDSKKLKPKWNPDASILDIQILEYIFTIISCEQLYFYHDLSVTVRTKPATFVALNVLAKMYSNTYTVINVQFCEKSSQSNTHASNCIK